MKKFGKYCSCCWEWERKLFTSVQACHSNCGEQIWLSFTFPVFVFSHRQPFCSVMCDIGIVHSATTAEIRKSWVKLKWTLIDGHQLCRFHIELDSVDEWPRFMLQFSSCIAHDLLCSLLMATWRAPMQRKVEKWQTKLATMLKKSSENWNVGIYCFVSANMHTNRQRIFLLFKVESKTENYWNGNMSRHEFPIS